MQALLTNTAVRSPRARAVARMSGTGLLAAIVLGNPMLAAGQEWTQFRGPGASGVVADNARLPERWSATENVAWRTEVPGLAWSSPIVARGMVVVTTVVSEGEVEAPEGGWYAGGERDVSDDRHHWLVYGLDLASGETLWRTEVHTGVPESSNHMKNTFGSATPVTDGEYLYVLFGNLGLYALDFNGAIRWSRELHPARTRAGWGTASSPALHDGRLYLVTDTEEQSHISTVSTETGADVWRTDRDEGSNWSTPYVWEHEQRTEIVTTGTDKVRSYDLDGTLLWELAGMSSIVIPTPMAAHGLLYIESGYLGDFSRPVYAIRPGASGDISLAEGASSNEHVAWSLAQGGSYHPSPLVYGDNYYTLLDRGMMTAHDARTGAEVYGRQRIAVGEGFTSSPWAYNGKIFLLSEDGETYVVEAGPEFKILHKNSLNEMSLATPAVVRGSLLLRTQSKLYRIAKKDIS